MPPRVMDLFYLPAILIAAPILLYQRVVRGKKRGGWAQRFGQLEQRDSGRRTIWIHAVSLGEVNATRSLVAAIRERLPEYDVVISTTTDTGYAAACTHYPSEYVFRYPLDFSDVVRRVLRTIRPVAIVLMELEVWPNLIALAARQGIPVGIANGRVTEGKSMRRFRLPIVRPLARRMFSRVAWIGAQDDVYAYRFVELGTPPERIAVTGSLKYDTAEVMSSVPGDTDLAHEMGIDTERPLFVAGSTGPGEEEALLAAFRELMRAHPETQLAIIPRKPERFDEVAALMAAKGWRCIRRSHGAMAKGAEKTPVVFLGDTMGELRKFYSLATGVFVGRSLVPMGGSDVIEVAALGKPMCFGPHMENFSDAVEQLLAGDAAEQISSAEQVVAKCSRWLSDRDAGSAMGRRARDIVRRNVGATQRTVELLLSAIDRG